MLQEVVWVLKTLILPPGGLVLIGLFGLMLGSRLLGRFLIVTALAGLYLLSTPFAADRLMAGLEVHPALTRQRLALGQAEGILLLGGGRYSDAPEYGADTVGPLLLERLRYAAWLVRKTGLPLFISGGSADEEQDVPEAQLARQVLEQEFGVTTAAIEDQSRTTWDNARLSKAMLEARGVGSVYLVTHAWHMTRALRIFEQSGVNAIAAPTAFYHKGGFENQPGDWLPDPRALLHSYYALHEYLGHWWYGLRRVAADV